MTPATLLDRARRVAFAAGARGAMLDDVAADVLLRRWRAGDSLRDEDAWLGSVAWERARSHRWKAARRTPAEDPEHLDRLPGNLDRPGPVAPPAVAETVARLLSGASALDAEAVDLHYLRGLSLRDAAAVAGCSRDAFAARLRRALSRLRTASPTLFG